MKILYCEECRDAIALGHEPRTCLCGKSAGYYTAGGVWAIYMGPAKLIGMPNKDVLCSELGERIEAWAIPIGGNTVYLSEERYSELRFIATYKDYNLHLLGVDKDSCGKHNNLLIGLRNTGDNVTLLPSYFKKQHGLVPVNLDDALFSFLLVPTYRDYYYWKLTPEECPVDVDESGQPESLWDAGYREGAEDGLREAYDSIDREENLDWLSPNERSCIENLKFIRGYIITIGTFLDNVTPFVEALPDTTLDNRSLQVDLQKLNRRFKDIAKIIG